jgi:hypothetical protein
VTKNAYSSLVAESYSGGKISFEESSAVNATTWEMIEKLKNGEVSLLVFLFVFLLLKLPPVCSVRVGQDPLLMSPRNMKSFKRNTRAGQRDWRQSKMPTTPSSQRKRRMVPNQSFEGLSTSSSRSTNSPPWEVRLGSDRQ